MYSNSKHDDLPGRGSEMWDESSVKNMYEFSPYPDLGSALKDPQVMLKPIIDKIDKDSEIKYLEAGCGTGHLLVGIAVSYPHWSSYGIDLSESSLIYSKKISRIA